LSPNPPQVDGGGKSLSPGLDVIPLTDAKKKKTEKGGDNTWKSLSKYGRKFFRKEKKGNSNDTGERCNGGKG